MSLDETVDSLSLPASVNANNKCAQQNMKQQQSSRPNSLASLEKVNFSTSSFSASNLTSTFYRTGSLRLVV